MILRIDKPRRPLGGFAAIAVAIAIAGGAYFRSCELAPAEPASADRLVLSLLAVPVGQPDEKPAVRVAPARAFVEPAKLQGSSLAAQMREATDLRKFAAEAMSKPALGGISYAIHATGLCREAFLLSNTFTDWNAADLAYAAPDDPNDHAARNAAFHKAKAACHGFTTSDYDSFLGEEDTYLWAQARAQGDSLQKLKAQAREAAQGDMAQRKAALAAVLENGDPLLLSETFERLLLDKGPDRGFAFWVDGAQVPVIESDVFQAALRVLPCRLGLVCDGRAPAVLQACLMGQCFPDQVELMRSRIAEEKREQFEAVLDRLEAAVRARSVASFLP